MKFVTYALQTAIAELLPDTGVDLAKLGYPVENIIDHDEAGDILAHLMFDGWLREGEQPYQPLSRATLFRPDGTLSMSPADAAEHPLLAGWTFGSLGDAVAKALWIGALRIDLEPGTPFIRGASSYAMQPSAGTGERQFGARFDYTLANGMMVALEFGAPIAVAPYSETRTISGAVLVSIGARARQVTDQLARAAAEAPRAEAA